MLSHKRLTYIVSVSVCLLVPGLLYADLNQSGIQEGINRFLMISGAFFLSCAYFITLYIKYRRGNKPHKWNRILSALVILSFGLLHVKMFFSHDQEFRLGYFYGDIIHQPYPYSLAFVVIWAALITAIYQISWNAKPFDEGYES